MTCIVGVVDNGKVYIGGDSAGVAGLDVIMRKDSKIFKNGDFLIGYTSSFRMGQLLRFKLDPPKYYPEKYDNSIYKYMCTDFIEEIRRCLKSGGYTNINSNKERGGVFLVGFKGRLFEIESDFQVGESLDAYNAVGCGEHYAKGSLFNSWHFHEGKIHDPDEIIKEALLAAEYFSGGVRSPFIIESI